MSCDLADDRVRKRRALQFRGEDSSEESTIQDRLDTQPGRERPPVVTGCRVSQRAKAGGPSRPCCIRGSSTAERHGQPREQNRSGLAWRGSRSARAFSEPAEEPTYLCESG